MNDSNNSSKGLLVLRLKGAATADLIDELMSVITPTAEALGVEPMVLPAGVDVDLQMGSSALLERVCVALEALVAQGQPPELSEPQIAPQALNDRPTGLNSRPVCKGDWSLGTACGSCERCRANRPAPPPAPPMRVGG